MTGDRLRRSAGRATGDRSRAGAVGGGVAGLLLLLAACGHGDLAASSCPPAARAALAHALGVPAVTGATSSTDHQTITTCEMRARAPIAGQVRVTVTLDTAPQAYFRLERTVVEEAQNFTQGHRVGPPQNLPGLGLDADWLPIESRLMTTDGARLVTVAVDWPSGRMTRRAALAGAVARAYLGPRGATVPDQGQG